MKELRRIYIYILYIYIYIIYMYAPSYLENIYDVFINLITQYNEVHGQLRK